MGKSYCTDGDSVRNTPRSTRGDGRHPPPHFFVGSAPPGTPPRCANWTSEVATHLTDKDETDSCRRQFSTDLMPSVPPAPFPLRRESWREVAPEPPRSSVVNADVEHQLRESSMTSLPSNGSSMQ